MEVSRCYSYGLDEPESEELWPWNIIFAFIPSLFSPQYWAQQISFLSWNTLMEAFIHSVSPWDGYPSPHWNGSPQGHDLLSGSKVNVDRHGLFDVETSLTVQENPRSILCSIQHPDLSLKVESEVWIGGEWGGDGGAGKGWMFEYQRENRSLYLRIVV